MIEAALGEAALVLLGHGSTQHEGSSATARQHADALRRRAVFHEVQEAFWKQDPKITDVLARITAPIIFIVPLFISEGYFTEHVIPRALGFRGADDILHRSRQANDQRLIYCQPIGTHDDMTDVVLSRARDIIRQFPFPRAPEPVVTTLFIAGHGTEANENSRVSIERQASRIAQLNLYASVHAVFLEEPPRIAECLELAQSRHLIVVPYFISDGLHVRSDIPALLGEPPRLVQQRLARSQPPWRNPTERRGKLIWYTASVGSDPGVANVILKRVNEAASL